MNTIFISILLIFLLASCSQRENYFEKSWTHLNDRVWVGSEFWANRLQDWKVQNDRLECVADNPRLLMRTAHLINCRLGNEKGDFFAEVEMGPLKAEANGDAAGGFLIGAAPELDVWGASLVQQKPGPGAGLFVGITSTGHLFMKDMESGNELKGIEGG